MSEQPAAASTRWAGRLSDHRVLLLAIVALGAYLRFVDLGRLGLSNLFYAATVRSMLHSGYNFLFAAFDPEAVLMVDKPPLSLWIQVLSVKLFGYSGFSLILPQALAGTLVIPVLYLAVRKGYGVKAGLLAAATLAVLPESVATSRDSTMDSMMLLLLVCAALVAQIAVQRQRLLWFLVWGVVMGLVFNVKYLAGFVALPAFGVYYLLAGEGRWKLRMARLAASGAVLTLVALAWVVFVWLTPAGERPLIMNSQHNSIWELIAGYNGLDRVLHRAVAVFAPVPGRPGLSSTLEQSARNFGVGDAGPTRLFVELNGALMGVPLLLALAGLALIILRPSGPAKGPGLLWGLWFATGLLLFSFANRAAAHYMEAFVPAVAALAGIGLAGWANLYRERGLFRAIPPLIGIAILVYALVVMGNLEPLRGPALAVASIGGVAMLVELGGLIGHVSRAGLRNLETAALGLGIAALVSLSAVPSLWIALEAPANGPIPAPNPLVFIEQDRGSGTSPAPMRQASISAVPNGRAVVTYTTKGQGTKYVLGVDGINRAAELIALTGQPVLPMWSEYLREPVFKVEQLQEKVARREVRYFFTAPLWLDTFYPEFLRWLRADCRDVSREAGAGQGWRLWDCAASTRP